jgi:hypothetical protein
MNNPSLYGTKIDFARLKGDPVIKKAINLDLDMDLTMSKTVSNKKSPPKSVSRRNTPPALVKLPVLPQTNTKLLRNMLKKMKRMSEEQQEMIVELETILATSAKEVDSQDNSIPSRKSSSRNSEVIQEEVATKEVEAIKLAVKITNDTNEQIQEMDISSKENVLVNMFDLFTSTLANYGAMMYAASTFKNLTNVIMNVCSYLLATLTYVFSILTQTTLIGFILTISLLWAIYNSGIPGASTAIEYLLSGMMYVGKKAGGLMVKKPVELAARYLAKNRLSIQSIQGFLQGVANTWTTQTVSMIMDNVKPLLKDTMWSITEAFDNSIDNNRILLMTRMQELGATISSIQSGFDKIQYLLVFVGLIVSYLSYQVAGIKKNANNNDMLEYYKENMMRLENENRQLREENRAITNY